MAQNIVNEIRIKNVIPVSFIIVPTKLLNVHSRRN